MNKLKKIYYPILAVLLVVLVVFSVLSVKVNFSTPFISTSTAKANAVKIAESGNYDITDDSTSKSSSSSRYDVVSSINTIIKNTLTKKYKTVYDTNGNVKSYPSSSISSTSDILMGQYVEIENEKEVKKYELAPAYYSANITLNDSDLNAIANAKDRGYYKDMVVQNIMLFIPGTQTKKGLARSPHANNYSFSYDEKKLADVMMMVAHYDSDAGDNGYVNNSLTIGTMLALLDEIINGGKSYKNDILMVFTDASYRDGLGIDVLLNTTRYEGFFGDAISRTKSIAVFDNVGEVSTIVASQAKGSDTVSVFATAGDWYHSGSFSGNIASANMGNKEFNAINGISAIEILGVGNKSEITTASSLNDSMVERVACVIGSYADRFGNADLGILDSDATIGFYSYIGLNFWFASYVAYIIGAIILALAGVIAWYVIKKKALNPVKTGYGVAVSVLSVLATVATLTVLYLLLALLLSLIGAVSVNAIGSLITDNVLFFIIVFVLSLVLLAIYNVVFKNVFKVKALDVIKGNAWFIMLVGAVMCFVFPTYSYLFAGLAIAQGATMLCCILLKDKFKNKFGFDIERLLPYGAFAILLLPVVVAEVLVVYSVAPAIFLPLTLSIVLVYAQSIIPYVLIIKDLLGISSKKNAQEKTEDEEQSKLVAEKKKAIIEKKPVLIASAITALAYIAVLVTSLLSVNHNGLNAMQSRFYGDDVIYNNAFVYEYNNKNGKTSQSILLKDLDLYAHMKSDLGAFEWNAERNAYTLSDSIDVADLPMGSKDYVPYYNNNTKLFKFSTNDSGNNIRLGEKPAMTVTFKTSDSADKIENVRLINNIGSNKTTESTSVKFEEFVINGNTATVEIPAGYGSDLAIEVFAKSSDPLLDPVVGLDVKVNIVYVAGNLDKMGDISVVSSKNETISKLSSKYSNSEILENIYFVFEYNYQGKINIPSIK